MSTTTTTTTPTASQNFAAYRAQQGSLTSLKADLRALESIDASPYALKRGGMTAAQADDFKTRLLALTNDLRDAKMEAETRLVDLEVAVIDSI